MPLTILERALENARPTAVPISAPPARTYVRISSPKTDMSVKKATAKKKSLIPKMVPPIASRGIPIFLKDILSDLMITR